MVAVSFAPVQPRGWPSAMAPPLTLTIVGIESRGADHGEGLGGEGFVEFDDADVVELQSGERERFRDRDHRTDAHDLRRDSGGGEADEAGFRFEAEFARFRRRHDESRRGAIAGLRRIARRHGAVDVEDGLQFRESFERSIGARAFVLIENGFGVDRLRAGAI